MDRLWRALDFICEALGTAIEYAMLGGSAILCVLITGMLCAVALREIWQVFISLL